MISGFSFSLTFQTGEEIREHADVSVSTLLGTPFTKFLRISSQTDSISDVESYWMISSLKTVTTSVVHAFSQICALHVVKKMELWLQYMWKREISK